MTQMQSNEASTIARLIRIFAEQRRLAQRELEAALLIRNSVDTAAARLTIQRLMAESSALRSMLHGGAPGAHALH